MTTAETYRLPISLRLLLIIWGIIYSNCFQCNQNLPHASLFCYALAILSGVLAVAQVPSQEHTLSAIEPLYMHRRFQKTNRPLCVCLSTFLSCLQPASTATAMMYINSKSTSYSSPLESRNNLALSLKAINRICR